MSYSPPQKWEILVEALGELDEAMRAIPVNYEIGSDIADIAIKDARKKAERVLTILNDWRVEP